jgi:hypothetical protein
MELSADVGGSWSNSYVVSLLEAEQIVYAELPSSAAAVWVAMSDAEKKQALVAGAEFLGFAFTLRGYKAFHDQRLAFPRREFSIRGHAFSGYDATPDPPVENPYNVKVSQVYCAIFIIQKNRTDLSATTDSERKGVTSFSISGLNISLGTTVAGAGTIEEYIKSQHLTLHLLMQEFVTQSKGGAVKHRRQYAAVATTSTTTTTSVSTSSTSTTTTTQSTSSTTTG